MKIVYHPTEEFLGLEPMGWYWITDGGLFRRMYGPFDTYSEAEADMKEST